jgi:hypothetical protein
MKHSHLLPEQPLDPLVAKSYGPAVTFHITGTNECGDPVSETVDYPAVDLQKALGHPAKGHWKTVHTKFGPKQVYVQPGQIKAQVHQHLLKHPGVTGAHLAHQLDLPHAVVTHAVSQLEDEGKLVGKVGSQGDTWHPNETDDHLHAHLGNLAAEHPDGVSTPDLVKQAKDAGHQLGGFQGQAKAVVGAKNAGHLTEVNQKLYHPDHAPGKSHVGHYKGPQGYVELQGDHHPIAPAVQAKDLTPGIIRAYNGATHAEITKVEPKGSLIAVTTKGHGTDGKEFEHTSHHKADTLIAVHPQHFQHGADPESLALAAHAHSMASTFQTKKDLQENPGTYAKHAKLLQKQHSKYTDALIQQAFGHFETEAKPEAKPDSPAEPDEDEAHGDPEKPGFSLLKLGAPDIALLVKEAGGSVTATAFHDFLKGKGAAPSTVKDVLDALKFAQEKGLVEHAGIGKPWTLKGEAAAKAPAAPALGFAQTGSQIWEADGKHASYDISKQKNGFHATDTTNDVSVGVFATLAQAQAAAAQHEAKLEANGGEPPTEEPAAEKKTHAQSVVEALQQLGGSGTDPQIAGKMGLDYDQLDPLLDQAEKAKQIYWEAGKYHLGQKPEKVDVHAPVVSPATQVLSEEPVGNGTAVVLAKVASGYSVGMKDQDSGHVIGVKIYPTEAAAKEAAQALAQQTKQQNSPPPAAQVLGGLSPDAHELFDLLSEPELKAYEHCAASDYLYQNSSLNKAEFNAALAELQAAGVVAPKTVQGVAVLGLTPDWLPGKAPQAAAQPVAPVAPVAPAQPTLPVEEFLLAHVQQHGPTELGEFMIAGDKAGYTVDEVLDAVSSMGSSGQLQSGGGLYDLPFTPAPPSPATVQAVAAVTNPNHEISAAAKNTLAILHENPSGLSAGDIGKHLFPELKSSTAYSKAEKVLNLLAAAGGVQKVGSKWLPTDLGSAAAAVQANQAAKEAPEPEGVGVNGIEWSKDPATAFGEAVFHAEFAGKSWHLHSLYGKTTLYSGNAWVKEGEFASTDAAEAHMHAFAEALNPAPAPASPGNNLQWQPAYPGAEEDLTAQGKKGLYTIDADAPGKYNVAAEIGSLYQPVGVFTSLAYAQEGAEAYDHGTDLLKQTADELLAVITKSPGKTAAELQAKWFSHLHLSMLGKAAKQYLQGKISVRGGKHYPFGQAPAKDGLNWALGKLTDNNEKFQTANTPAGMAQVWNTGEKNQWTGKFIGHDGLADFAYKMGGPWGTEAEAKAAVAAYAQQKVQAATPAPAAPVAAPSAPPAVTLATPAAVDLSGLADPVKGQEALTHLHAGGALSAKQLGHKLWPTDKESTTYTKLFKKNGTGVMDQLLAAGLVEKQGAKWAASAKASVVPEPEPAAQKTAHATSVVEALQQLGGHGTTGKIAGKMGLSFEEAVDQIAEAVAANQIHWQSGEYWLGAKPAAQAEPPPVPSAPAAAPVLDFQFSKQPLECAKVYAKLQEMPGTGFEKLGLAVWPELHKNTAYSRAKKFVHELLAQGLAEQNGSTWKAKAPAVTGDAPASAPAAPQAASAPSGGTTPAAPVNTLQQAQAALQAKMEPGIGYPSSALFGFLGLPASLSSVNLLKGFVSKGVLEQHSLTYYLAGTGPQEPQTPQTPQTFAPPPAAPAPPPPAPALVPPTYAGEAIDPAKEKTALYHAVFDIAQALQAEGHPTVTPAMIAEKLKLVKQTSYGEYEVGGFGKKNYVVQALGHLAKSGKAAKAEGQGYTATHFTQWSIPAGATYPWPKGKGTKSAKDTAAGIASTATPAAAQAGTPPGLDVPQVTAEQVGHLVSGKKDLSVGAMTKVGEKPGGTVNGAGSGIYQDADGQKHIVKHAFGGGGSAPYKYWADDPGDEHARSEVLATKLALAAGVPAPECQLTDLAAAGFPGKTGIASALVDISAGKYSDPQWVKVAQQQFAVHAWLGNWDVVGASQDNMVTGPDGLPVCIDWGGSLLFRAQGKKKWLEGDNTFGPEVAEWDTFTSGSFDAVKLFGSMTAVQKVESAKKVAAISDEAIDALVNEWGPSNPAEREKLRSVLKARRDNIVKRASDELASAAAQSALKAKEAQQLASLSSLLTTKWEGVQATVASVSAAFKAVGQAAVKQIQKPGTASAYFQQWGYYVHLNDPLANGETEVAKEKTAKLVQDVLGIDLNTFNPNQSMFYTASGSKNNGHTNAAYKVEPLAGSKVKLWNNHTTESAHTKAYNELPQYLKDAVYSYSGGGYTGMNGKLRIGEAPTNAQQAASGFAKAAQELPAGSYVERGLSLGSKVLANLADSIGVVIQEPGFSSASPTAPWAGDTTLCIYAAPGAKALNLTGVGQHKGEDELLYGPNQRYLVFAVGKGKDVKGQNKTLVHCIALPPEDWKED